VRVFIVR